MSNTSGEIFAKFVEVVKQLRNPDGGCPWDLEQTHETIRQYLIEETYEVLEAIDAKDDTEFVAELGDLLLQVVLHSQIARDRKAFSIDDVVRGITEKMIRRHPHVFGEKKVGSSDEVLTNWERSKLAEKSDSNKSALSGVPVAMPALVRAQRLGQKAARVTFDWPTLGRVFDDVVEEINELKVELEKEKLLEVTQPEKAHPTHPVQDELGDVLFSLCQLSRWLGFSAEDALRGASDKFSARFAHVEQNAPKPLPELSLEELEGLWDAAKKAV